MIFKITYQKLLVSMSAGLFLSSTACIKSASAHDSDDDLSSFSACFYRFIESEKEEHKKDKQAARAAGMHTKEEIENAVQVAQAKRQDNNRRNAIPTYLEAAYKRLELNTPKTCAQAKIFSDEALRLAKAVEESAYRRYQTAVKREGIEIGTEEAQNFAEAQEHSEAVHIVSKTLELCKQVSAQKALHQEKSLEETRQNILPIQSLDTEDRPSSQTMELARKAETPQAKQLRVSQENVRVNTRRNSTGGKISGTRQKSKIDAARRLSFGTVAQQ